MLKYKSTPPRGAFDYLLKGDPWKETTPAPKTTPPPPPPERGGKPVRVHVEIEIIQRHAAGAGRAVSAFALVFWAIVALILLAAVGHAQPAARGDQNLTPGIAAPRQWQSYRQGFQTLYQGSDAQGRNWTGQSYPAGDGTTIFDAQGPDGATVHCRSYKLGFTEHTECNQ